MEGKGRGLGRAVRRGVALGLTGAALWCMSWAADLTGWLGRAKAAGERSAVAVALLSAQLGDSAGTDKLSRWSRLVLSQSALLRAGLGTAAEETDPEEHPEPSSGEEHEEDREEPRLSHQGDDGIIEMTAQGKSGGKYLFGQGVYLYNRTGYDLDESVLTQGRVDVNLGEGPQILIVHTHGSEAYAQTDGDTYEPSDPYRTTDCTHNVVRVGEEMATVFRAHGFGVVHDPTLYDYPSYTGAYDRSGAAVEQWLSKYPTIKIVLDVHRDALVGNDGQVYKMVAQEAGQKVAQVMLVVGSDGGGKEHPRWRDNLAFAVLLQQGLTRGYSQLARPIVLRNSRYNQQLLPGSLLVEVGGHGNTLTEAVDAARLWADNVARTLLAREKG